MNDQPETVKKPFYKKWWGILLIGILILFVLMIITGDPNEDGDSGNSNSDSETAEAPAPARQVTATDISAAYQENEAKAQLEYGEGPLEVSGTVKDVSLDFADNPVIKLKGANDTHGMGINQNGKMTDVDIAGLSQEDAAAINKGSEMTFRCGGASELMGGAQLDDCVVVQ